jgi:hypothetical protein
MHAPLWLKLRNPGRDSEALAQPMEFRRVLSLPRESFHALFFENYPVTRSIMKYETG